MEQLIRILQIPITAEPQGSSQAPIFGWELYARLAALRNGCYQVASASTQIIESSYKVPQDPMNLKKGLFAFITVILERPTPEMSSGIDL